MYSRRELKGPPPLLFGLDTYQLVMCTHIILNTFPIACTLIINRLYIHVYVCIMDLLIASQNLGSMILCVNSSITERDLSSQSISVIRLFFFFSPKECVAVIQEAVFKVAF